MECDRYPEFQESFGLEGSLREEVYFGNELYLELVPDRYIYDVIFVHMGISKTNCKVNDGIESLVHRYYIVIECIVE